MEAIFADDLRRVAVLVVGLNLDVTRVGDDMVVGEDVALFVEDEAGTLIGLGDVTVEEIEGYGSCGDVDD